MHYSSVPTSAPTIIKSDYTDCAQQHTSSQNFASAVTPLAARDQTSSNPSSGDDDATTVGVAKREPILVGAPLLHHEHDIFTTNHGVNICDLDNFICDTIDQHTEMNSAQSLRFQCQPLYRLRIMVRAILHVTGTTMLSDMQRQQLCNLITLYHNKSGQQSHPSNIMENSTKEMDHISSEDMNMYRQMLDWVCAHDEIHTYCQ